MLVCPSWLSSPRKWTCGSDARANLWPRSRLKSSTPMSCISCWNAQLQPHLLFAATTAVQSPPICRQWVLDCAASAPSRPHIIPSDAFLRSSRTGRSLARVRFAAALMYEGAPALQTMHLADRMLMEGLKQKCAVLLHPHVTRATALSLLEEATSLDAPRLVLNPYTWLQYH